MRKLKRAGMAAIWTGLAIAVAGTVLHYTIRDRWLVTALIYYATPWLLRALMGIAACIFLWRRRGCWKCVAIAVTICALIQGAHSFRHDSPPAPGTTTATTVAVWNTGHRFYLERALWPAAAETDICAIIETGRFDEAKWADFAVSSPGMNWQRLDAGTALGLKGGEVLESTAIHSANDPFRAFRVRARLPRTGELTIVVVDINSQPWHSRQPSLAAIRNAISGADLQHAIILGDFNTPSESIWLRDWRQSGLSLANEGPRSGMRETWPYGIPLMTLDQIWTGALWDCQSVTHQRFGSDHAKVIATLAPPPTHS